MMMTISLSCNNGYHAIPLIIVKIYIRYTGKSLVVGQNVERQNVDRQNVDRQNAEQTNVDNFFFFLFNFFLIKKFQKRKKNLLCFSVATLFRS